MLRIKTESAISKTILDNHLASICGCGGPALWAQPMGPHLQRPVTTGSLIRQARSRAGLRGVSVGWLQVFGGCRFSMNSSWLGSIGSLPRSMAPLMVPGLARRIPGPVLPPLSR
jgi:hypothetical protein